MKKFKPLLLLIVGMTMLQSCKLTGNVMRMFSTEVNVNEFKNEDKKILFVEMIHVGKKDFYKKVAEEVQKAKEQGAVLFYENIDYSNSDTVTLRKTQKMLGFVPTSENYAIIMKDLMEDDKTI